MSVVLWEPLNAIVMSFEESPELVALLEGGSSKFQEKLGIIPKKAGHNELIYTLHNPNQSFTLESVRDILTELGIPNQNMAEFSASHPSKRKIRTRPKGLKEGAPLAEQEDQNVNIVFATMREALGLESFVDDEVLTAIAKDIGVEDISIGVFGNQSQGVRLSFHSNDRQLSTLEVVTALNKSLGTAFS